MRTGWMCGLEESGGLRLPKICCPTDALDKNPTTTPKPEETTGKEPMKEKPLKSVQHPFSSHKNLVSVADLGNCGKETVFSRIVGGQASYIKDSLLESISMFVTKLFFACCFA
jgi:hypothetical protein